MKNLLIKLIICDTFEKWIDKYFLICYSLHTNRKDFK